MQEQQIAADSGANLDTGNPGKLKQMAATASDLSDAIKPLQLALISPEELRLQSLFPAGAGFALDLGGEKLSGHFVPATEVGPMPYQVQVTLNQFPLELQLDAVLLNAICSCLSPDLPLDVMPPKLILALLQCALAPTIATLTPDNRLQIRVTDFQSPAASRLNGVRVAATCVIQNRPCWFALTLNEDTLGILEQSFARRPIVPRARHNITAMLPLELAIRFRGTQLSRQEICDLGLHDIVLLPPQLSAISQQRPLPVELWGQNQCLFTANLLGTNLQIDKPVQDNPMKSPSKDRNGAGVDLLADVPMDVVFEVARQVMTLEQLQSLAAGQVFALDKPLQGPVTLYAQGVAIAEAELVQIQDRVGARITRLLMAGDVDEPTQPSPLRERKVSSGRDSESGAATSPKRDASRMKEFFAQASSTESNESSGDESLS